MMIYAKWLLMVPVMLLVSALTFPLAFVLPFFVEYREGWHGNAGIFGYGWYLKPWLNWFQTPDNSIDGDYGWQHEHWQWRFKLPAPISTYVGRVGWLWRNPGYGFGVVYLVDFEHHLEATYAGNHQVNDSPGVEGYCLVHARELFQLVWVKRISTNKCVYCNFGWGIKGLLDGDKHQQIATFQFSPRISTWKD